MSKPLAALCGNDGDEINYERSVLAPSALLVPDTVESPLQTLVGDFRSALDEFRDNWQRELKSHSGRATPTVGAEAKQQHMPPSVNVNNIQDEAEADEQKMAENLFRRAAELEQRGKVYDALPLYRKAIQIVPDIEFKYHEHQKIKTNGPDIKAYSGGGRVQTPMRNDTFDAEELVEDLYEKFQMDLARDCGGRLLLSNRDVGVISTEAHISDMPPEIILYILRWVVSAQLDLRSLEQCAAVCKGLYLCARDEELWRLACLKVWGVNVGTLGGALGKPADDVIGSDDQTDPVVYTSWRQMYIERERVLFNGCYISKTTYLRMGENSFQDQYYRPVQLVEYYRYVRFLPDGSVLMMTTADEPAQGVTKLKQLQQLRPDVLRGHYRLYGNTVTILLKKQQRTIGGSTNQYTRQRRGSLTSFNEECNSTKYRIEFRIVNATKRKFAQLIWMHYSVVQTRNKIETSSEFELTASKYPPLWFSPVRSYHLDADAPLA